MYMQSPFLFELDPKIEGIFCSARKKFKLKEKRAKAQKDCSTMAGEREDQRRMLRDFATLGVQGIASSIT